MLLSQVVELAYIAYIAKRPATPTTMKIQTCQVFVHYLEEIRWLACLTASLGAFNPSVRLGSWIGLQSNFTARAGPRTLSDSHLFPAISL